MITVANLWQFLLFGRTSNSRSKWHWRKLYLVNRERMCDVERSSLSIWSGERIWRSATCCTVSRSPPLYLPHTVMTSSTAEHYGIQRTLHNILKRCNWTRIRDPAAKICFEYQQYKPNYLKPAGLMQTSPAKQFFLIVSNLFWTPPDHKTRNYNNLNRWMDGAVSSTKCHSPHMSYNVSGLSFLRYGFPGRLINDNGTYRISQLDNVATLFYS